MGKEKSFTITAGRAFVGHHYVKVYWEEGNGQLCIYDGLEEGSDSINISERVLREILEKLKKEREVILNE